MRSHHREIEDKANGLGIALRDLRLAIDLSGIHGNSDRPVYYQAWLAIPDTALPAKGTGHRKNRNDDTATAALEVNKFVASDLWRLQGFPPDSLPAGLNESSFCVPSSKSHLQSADARRNLTDCQETSQWIAGPDVMEKCIKGALGCSVHFISTVLGFTIE